MQWLKPPSCGSVPPRSRIGLRCAFARTRAGVGRTKEIADSGYRIADSRQRENRRRPFCCLLSAVCYLLSAVCYPLSGNTCCDGRERRRRKEGERDGCADFGEEGGGSGEDLCSPFRQAHAHPLRPTMNPFS